MLDKIDQVALLLAVFLLRLFYGKNAGYRG
jgi:hypothetical protein